ncbi:NAD-dependent epimerase/dehydratase family protein [Pedobacter cryophilus]|uniref:NAD-dependent epimerase/dehydratase family protein n=1 Tax=Pedobacter cryophilus TaxID=2571271 RepID=A0A4U1CA59_9SPHI|nr:NAD-dependent epimerase/dehydratase family protein [Pedobacter cryophilus]TKC00568.1 NAD-dependent epimerase/dehydratase family protein [Pedobacter cryophilus]
MILVTGATGFLGAELVVQLLQKETQIKCIKRANSAIPQKLIPFNDKIEWLIADILDYSDLDDAFEGISKVYHCAALVSFDPSLKQKMLAINAEGTANIVNLCLSHSVKKLVHVSSIAALGEAKEGELIDEKIFWEGFESHDAYSVSKYRAEMEVWRGINEGLNAVIVNPSIIIGEDAGTAGSGALFETVKSGIKYYTRGAGGFVDVKDVAKAMILLMESEVSNERFIINAENYSYKNLFTEIAQAFHLPVPTKEAKPWMLALVWRANAIKNAITNAKGGLTKSTSKSASTIREFNNAKIKKQLNLEFIPISQSITKIVNSLKIS